MSKQNDTDGGMMKVTKTELVWPGKHNDDGTLREVPRINRDSFAGAVDGPQTERRPSALGQ